jgi:four helix bundle protein
MELVEAVYKLTDTLPKDEKYGLISQMRRSAVSIPSNIAEGRYRGSRKDYANFLRTAFGSGAELETQLEICKRIAIGKKRKETRPVNYSRKP